MTTSTWLIDLFEEQGSTLHRLCVMLGAETESGHILRTSLLGLAKRSNRIVDPGERVEYLAEMVVHQSRSVRGAAGGLALASVADPRQEEICRAVKGLPIRLGELLLVSHYLSVFGPELAGIMRMTVRSCNQRLEEGLEALRRAVGDPGPGSVPGVIESLSQELTAALRSAARLVQAPGTETLEAELRSLKGNKPTVVPMWAAVMVVCMALFAGGTVALATTRRPQTLPTPTISATAVPTAVTSRSLPTQLQNIPVYYVGRQDQRLYREQRDLAGGGDLVTSVVEAVLTLAPLDPDYHSAWNPGRVVSAELNGNRLVISLSAESFPSDVTDEQAAVAIDQMVYTVTEILGQPELAVSFTASGQAPPEPFQGVHQRRGMTSLAPVWIVWPSNNAKVASGTVVISGLVQPAAEQPRVLVSDSSGTLLSSQFAQTSLNKTEDGWFPWTVSVNLTPGTYLIRVETSYTDESGADLVAYETRSVVVL